jgi:hypothetical protein
MVAARSAARVVPARSRALALALALALTLTV